MVVLDSGIVNVALPSIQVALGFAQPNLECVISAYALAFAGFSSWVAGSPTSWGEGRTVAPTARL